jgi:glycosyl hydrolase family 95
MHALRRFSPAILLAIFLSPVWSGCSSPSGSTNGGAKSSTGSSGGAVGSSGGAVGSSGTSSTPSSGLGGRPSSGASSGTGASGASGSETESGSPLDSSTAQDASGLTQSEGGGDDTGIAVTAFAVDTPNVVRRANVVLSKANTAPQDFMALGNGALGMAVWAANGFTAQLNRVDTFPDRKSVGQVVIPGLAALTGAADFSGHVDLYDGTLIESGGGMSATIFVRADAPEVVIDVTGADPNSTQTAQIKLWSGRSPSGAAAGGVATLAESWNDSDMAGSGKTFGVLSAVTAAGKSVTASVVDPLTVQVAFQPNADGSFRVIIAAPSWSGGDAMMTANGVLGSDAMTPLATLEQAHLAWWHAYWGQVGLVEMTSSDGSADYLEALRTAYLFLSAAESGAGSYPGSQAGVADLFNYLQDSQPWFPAGYWFWNLRMQVAANMTSGAFATNAPVFSLYQSNVANIAAWTQSKMNGRSGICVPETMRFNGNGYYNDGEGNASCDQAASPSYNALTLTSGTEVALWVWQQYLLTQDLAFLSTNYPIMSQAATFLLAYATQGSDGLLHTVANAHETQWDVQDPTTDIVAMQALFPVVVSAAGILATDASLVSQLQAALSKIPPLPRTDQASHTQLLTASSDSGGQDVFAISYQPAAQKHNGENLDLEAVWPYGLIGDAGDSTALAQRTYAHRMFVHSADWSFDALQAARLGLASEVATDLVALTQQYQSFVNGLGLLSGGSNDGTSEPYIEQAGVAAAAINEALVQDYDGLLRIAPAWPPSWDAAGTVYIQGKSKVDVQIQGGKVVLAIVEAGSTTSLMTRNPWPGQSAVVVDGATNAAVVAATTASTFNVPIVSGHWYAIVPASAQSAIPTVRVTGTPATAKKTLGSVAIGL